MKWLLLCLVGMGLLVALSLAVVSVCMNCCRSVTSPSVRAQDVEYSLSERGVDVLLSHDVPIAIVGKRLKHHVPVAVRRTGDEYGPAAHVVKRFKNRRIPPVNKLPEVRERSTD